MHALQTIGLGYAYPSGVAALHDISLSVERGEFAALIGPNGSGKTTLLRHFTGALQPTAGSVFVAGKEVTRRGDWLYREIGFVFQDPNDQLFAATVAEDVAFGPRNLGLDGEEVERRVRQSLNDMGLQDQSERPVHNLSFGQKRRAALAGVLAMQPSVIILDEPTSGLDHQGSDALLRHLQDLNRRRGITVLLATHDLDLLPSHIDRVFILVDGHLTGCGTPEEIFAQGRALWDGGIRVPPATAAMRLLIGQCGPHIADLPLQIAAPPGSAEDGGWEVAEQQVPASHALQLAQAAAAAHAAAALLLGAERVDDVSLRNALGRRQTLPISSVERLGDYEAVAACAATSSGGARARVCLRASPGLRLRIGGDWKPTSLGAPIVHQVIADALHSLAITQGLTVDLEFEV